MTTGNLQIKKGIYYTVIRVDGKQQWQSTKVHVDGKSKRDRDANLKKANMILAERLAEKDSFHTVNTNIKFLDMAAEWMERKSRDVRQDTMESYRAYFDNHISTFFSKYDLYIKDVTPQHIQRYIDYEYSNGISSRSIKKYLVIINGTMLEALRFNYIQFNPCDRVVLPKEKRFVGKAYNASQANKLLAVASGEQVYPAIVLGLYLGLRRSEVAGLRWQDIDFENKVVHIRNTVVKMTSTFEGEQTKNDTSRRDLYIDDNMVAFFKSLKEHAIGDNIHVCTMKDGSSMTPDYITHAFSKLLKKNNLPPIRFHELRHTAGSLLLNSGASVKQVQQYLGHSKASTTLDIYTHLDEQSQINTFGVMMNVLPEL